MKNNIAKLQSYYHIFFRSSELRRNITKVFSGDVLARIISIGTAIIIIRGLSVNDYAVYTTFYAILLLVPGLIGNGVDVALVRFSAEYISKEEQKPLELYFISFIFQLILYGLLGVVIFLFSDKVNDVLFGGKSFVTALNFGLLGGVGFLISQAGRGVYNAEERFGAYVKTLWVRQVLAFGVIFLLYLTGLLNFYMVAYAVIVIELGIAGIISLHIFKDFDFYKVKVFLKDKSAIVKEFILSTRWLIAYFFILTCFQKLDIFMLSHFSTEKELANYGVAFRYYSLILLALPSIRAVLLPRFSKVDMQDLNKQHEFAYKWLKTTVWLIVPIGILDLTGKSLFVWINGAQYEKAFYVFVIFSIGVWLSLMFSPLVNVLIARKEFRFLFMLGVTAFTINFIGNYILIPLWGAFGAAFITIFSHGLINIFSAVKVFLSSK